MNRRTTRNQRRPGATPLRAVRSSPTPDNDTGPGLSPAAPVEHVIRVLRLPGGRATPFDGQWVQEYDPYRIGRAPDGAPLTAHLVTTPDVDKAMKFATFNEAAELWRKPSKTRRPDGEIDRPLTAFSCVIEPIDIAGGPLPEPPDGWPFGRNGEAS